MAQFVCVCVCARMRVYVHLDGGKSPWSVTCSLQGHNNELRFSRDNEIFLVIDEILCN